MTKITIQFHAVFEEIIEYITPIVHEFSLHLVLLQEKPFATCLVNAEELLSDCRNEIGSSGARELFICRAEPVCDAISRLDFFKKNPDGASIIFGVLAEGCLGQSVFSAETADSQFGRIAKKIANCIKKNTCAGVLAINTNSGASVFIKAFRYTNGALVLERSGVKMKPFAGGNLIRLEN